MPGTACHRSIWLFKALDDGAEGASFNGTKINRESRVHYPRPWPKGRRSRPPRLFSGSSVLVASITLSMSILKLVSLSKMARSCIAAESIFCCVRSVTWVR